MQLKLKTFFPRESNPISNFAGEEVHEVGVCVVVVDRAVGVSEEQGDEDGDEAAGRAGHQVLDRGVARLGVVVEPVEDGALGAVKRGLQVKHEEEGHEGGGPDVDEVEQQIVHGGRITRGYQKSEPEIKQS